ncbi:hypothetical protein [Polaribacter sp. Hel1_85]|uniref:hypothetical protein n=1 Tax=Polaribacter sp. Hel1_85 TaxID=1250005 RepID=UPI00052D412C|nr:hypothetical protein [Polaribacter sp. Hel1_85]KGL63457.1 hypothetical protein PHEL85_0493 [Polaribacter sp. Hel1_85]
MILSIVNTYFNTITNLRAEYSIEVTTDTCDVRNNALFWIDASEDTTESSRYLTEALIHLNCPKELLVKQQNLLAFCRTQGIGGSVSDATKPYGLYLDYTTVLGERKMEAFYWNTNGKIIKTSTYKFKYFSSENVLETTLPWIHSDLQETFLKLSSYYQISKESGVLTQYQNGSIKEYYIPFFWHPRVDFIIKDLPNSFQSQLNNNNCQDIHFRHIGFSTIKDINPVITLYFGAYMYNCPTNFKEFQKKVHKSSQILAKEIQNFVEI